MSVIIRLQLLPLSASAADVRSFFSGLRIPDGAVHIVGGPEGDAFIGFASDEDARQAMRRDRGKIHGEEIRLLLSSRAEMNQVISRAKAAALGHRAPSPTGQQSPSTPQISQEAPVSVTSMNWGGHAQTAIPLSSDDSGQPSSFAPDPSDYNKPLYTRGPPAQSPAKSPAETPFGAFRDPTRLPSTGGYQANFAQRDQHSPSDAPRFFGSQPSRGTVLNSSIGSGRGSGIGGLPMPPGHQNGSAYRGFPPSNAVSVDTQQLIEDRSHNQPQNYSSQTRTTGSLFQDMKQDMKTDSVDEVNGPATGANSNLPIHLRPPFGIPPAHLRGLLPVPQQSRGPGGRDVGTIDGRKERSSFQQDRVLFGRNDGVAQRDERERLPRFNRGRGSSPSEPRFMNGVPPRASQQQVVRNESWRDSGPTKNEKPWEALTSRGTSHNGPSGAPSHQRKTLLSSTSIPKPNGNSTTSGPSIQTTALPLVSASPPSSVRPSTIASDGALRYVEFSRLPTEMLRPAVLEQFLKPTVPLTVSSVKVVCSSQGIHLHTLVRFENSADAQAMIMRDGEMGIRVRPSTKAIFDEAVDGPPPITSQLPSLLHDLNTNDNRDGALPLDHNDSRDQLRKRTRSRSRSRSPRRRRGIRGRRRGFRSRSRSRDRDRNGRGARFGRRSRSRSPHRKTHQDPTRWCLQLTNVPFRCSEEELRQWFSERVRPTRLIRTFYADGNASDRWIAEFESESLLERARGIRGLCLGRTIKMNYIDNDLADELMKIEDKYGENKKIEGEKQLLADVKHFNYTPIRPVGECIRGRGGAVGIPLGRPINAFPPLAPVVPRMMMGPRGPMLPGLPPGMPPIIPPESAGGPSLGVLRGRGAMTMRGRSAPLGVRSGLFATKLNRIQSSAESGTEVEERIEAQVADENRAVLSENTGGEAHNSAVDSELVASIGPKGTVLSCRGFPSDITLEDVVGFFDRFPVDENSVRMRMGDDGVPTGECMLAIRDPESARNAVSSLAGKCLRGIGNHLPLDNLLSSWLRDQSIIRAVKEVLVVHIK